MIYEDSLLLLTAIYFIFFGLQINFDMDSISLIRQLDKRSPFVQFSPVSPPSSPYSSLDILTQPAVRLDQINLCPICYA